MLKSYKDLIGYQKAYSLSLEFGSERIPRSLLRGKRANAEQYCSLRIEDSPQLAVESFKSTKSRKIILKMRNLVLYHKCDGALFPCLAISQKVIVEKI
ncbi:MAG: hypothetical protein ABSG75_08905 [Syntrophales bacterium]|jgi:hypothetical protein